MELLLMDRGLQMVGQPLEIFSSLQWDRSYWGTDSFELHTAPELFDSLRAASYLFRRDTGEAGLIECLRYEQAEDGRVDCAVSGRGLEALLEARVIDATYRASGPAETVLQSLVDAYAIHPSDAGRAIPRLKLGAASGLGTALSLQVTGANLLDSLQGLARSQELAVRVRLDFLKPALVFEVWQGLDRTQGQSVNSWAVFSGGFENLRTLSYIRDGRQHKNFAYVAGEGEGAARRIVTVDLTGGGERRELYVDARDLQSEGEAGDALPQEDYLKLLRQRGLERLTQYRLVEAMDGTVDTGANLEYRRDFDLGDKCTVVGPGLISEARITQVREVYEPTGVRISASFGDGYLTDLSKYIRREVD